MICNNCGTNVPEGSARCYYCGAPMAAAPATPPAPKGPACTRCGAPLKEGSMFCTTCGTPVAPPAPPAAPPVAPPAPAAEPVKKPEPKAEVCTRCGAPLKPGSMFCTTCGQSISAAAPKAEPKPATCTTCGAPLVEGNTFCTTCGTPVTAAAAPKKEKKPRKPLLSFLDKLPVPRLFVYIGAGVLTTLILLAIILPIALSDSRKGTAEDFLEAYYECDVDNMLDEMPAEALSGIGNSLSYNYSYSDLVDEMEERSESALEYYEQEYGDNCDIEVEAIFVYEYTNRDLRDMSDRYESYYGVEVEEAARVLMLVTVEGNSREYGDTSGITVVKIDGTWYVDIFRLI